MDMGQDDPGRRSGRRLFETAYTRSPYRFTVIGYPDIFNELKPDDIHGYYREKYIPNNVFFVVVGEVKLEETVGKSVTPTPGPGRSHCRLSCCRRNRNRPRRARSLRKPHRTRSSAFQLARPELRHPDVPILEVLATLLAAAEVRAFTRKCAKRKGW